MSFCECKNAKLLEFNNRYLLEYDADYSWLIKWIELTEEKGYTQVHRYAIKISYCMFCGKKLKAPLLVKDG